MPSLLTTTLPPLVEVVGPEAVSPVLVQEPPLGSGSQSLLSRSFEPSGICMRTLPMTL